MKYNSNTGIIRNFRQTRIVILAWVTIIGLLFFWLFLHQSQYKLEEFTLYQAKTRMEALLVQGGLSYQTQYAPIAATTNLAPGLILQTTMPEHQGLQAWLLNPQGERLAFAGNAQNFDVLEKWGRELQLLLHQRAASASSSRVHFLVLPNHNYLLASLNITPLAGSLAKPVCFLLAYPLSDLEKQSLSTTHDHYWVIAIFLLASLWIGGYPLMGILFQSIARPTKGSEYGQPSDIESCMSPLGETPGRLDHIIYVLDPAGKGILYTSPYMELLLQQTLDPILTAEDKRMRLILELEAVLPKEWQVFQKGYQPAAKPLQWEAEFQKMTFHCTVQSQPWKKYKKAHMVIGLPEYNILLHSEKHQHNALLAQAFDNAQEGIIITDKKNKIVAINPAFTRIMGYSASESLHSNPNFFSSGRHDKKFYQEMWHSIHKSGHWEGEVWDRRKSGEIFPKYLTITRFTDKSTREERYLGFFSEISKLKNTEDRLKSLAYFDELTKLPNRMNCLDQLTQRLQLSKRNKHKLGVLYLNLDNFKSVNDSLGRTAGDNLLLQIRDVLSSSIRESDFLSRNHADEFIILLMDIQSPDNCIMICDQILEKLATVMVLDGHALYSKASIGISLYPDDGFAATQLMEKADMAMHHAKNKSRGSYHFFDQSMEAVATHKLELERQLHQAVENHEFIVMYQPQVQARDGKIIGLEALVRWKREDGTIVPPNDFIPFAEESGIIVAIGEQVLRQACSEFSSWVRDGILPVTLSVNFSIKQFHQKNLQALIEEILQSVGMEAKHLKVEITESMLMDEIQEAIHILSGLREQGVTSSIDDFGTGYSSLSYLQQFPVSDLKIDRTFVKNIVEEPQIATAIIMLANSLDLRVIAEGAETYQQLEKLVELGCELVQGYYFSRPLPGSEIKEVLRHQVIKPNDFLPFPSKT